MVSISLLYYGYKGVYYGKYVGRIVLVLMIKKVKFCFCVLKS